LYCVKGQLRRDAVLDGIKLEKKYGIIQASEGKRRSAELYCKRDKKTINNLPEDHDNIWQVAQENPKIV